jgi:hypothetical protein
MFRDPTKFYLLTAVGYSILIPASILFIQDFFKKRNMSMARMIPIIGVVFWLYTLKAVFMGQVTGNFRPTFIPQEYKQWKQMLEDDAHPSGVLWIPQSENYAFNSAIHPEFSSHQLFPNASLSGVMDITQTPEFTDALQQAGIGYVAVPIDVDKRLFLNDDQFDPSERVALVRALENTPLKANTQFKELAVFEYDSGDVTFQEAPFEAKLQQQWATNGAYLSWIVLITCICLALL